MQLRLIITASSLFTVSWLVRGSSGDNSFTFGSPALLRTPLPYIHPDIDDLFLRNKWKRQQPNQLIITPANQPQLALNWPRLSTWSILSQSIQLIANSPLISTGFVAIAIATILGFNDQLNFITVFVLLSAFLSFIGGIVELLNIVNTESSPVGKTPSASTTTAIFLGAAVFFKYIFLFFRFEQAMSTRASIMSMRDIIPPNPSPIWATPSWDQLGSFGRPLKIFALLVIFIVVVLEITWKIGVISAPNRFLSVLNASAALQMLLLLGLTAKTVCMVFKSKPASIPGYSTTKGIGPVLVGNGIGFASQILALEITVFPETPLGRFMNLIQVYFYMVDAAVHCARKESKVSSSNQLRQVTDDEKNIQVDTGLFDFPKPLPVAPNPRLISPSTPAFRSLPDAPKLPEISVLTQVGGNDNMISSSRGLQSATKDKDIAHQINHEPGKTSSWLRNEEALAALPDYNHPPPETRIRNGSINNTTFSASLNQFQIPSMQSWHSNTVSPKDTTTRRVSGVDDIGPAYSKPASTIFSRYYLGAYDSQPPPPLPSSEILKDYTVGEHTAPSPVIHEAVVLSEPPLPLALRPNSSAINQRNLVSRYSSSTLLDSSEDQTSIPTSSFSYSRMPPMEDVDGFSWANTGSVSRDFPVPPYTGTPGTGSPTTPRAHRNDLSTPLDLPFLMLPRAEDLGTSHGSSVEVKPLSLAHDNVRSPTTHSRLLPPPSVARPNSTRQLQEAGLLVPRGRFGSNIDVTSFIGSLTIPAIGKTDEDELESEILKESRDMEQARSGEGSRSALPTVGISRASTAFTASPTSSLQIIDNRGLPILRDIQSPSRHASQSASPAHHSVIASVHMAPVPTQTLTSPSLKDEPQLVNTSPLAIHPSIYPLPRMLSNSSLFRMSSTFEHPRPAPHPSGKKPRGN